MREDTKSKIGYRQGDALDLDLGHCMLHGKHKQTQKIYSQHIQGYSSIDNNGTIARMLALEDLINHHPLPAEDHSSSAAAPGNNHGDTNGDDDAGAAVVTRQQRDPIIRFHQVQIERYQEGSLHRVEETVLVVGFRRKTTLFGVLLLMAQFAHVDTFNMLPIGLILYSISLGMVMELLETPQEIIIESDLPSWEEIRRRLFEEGEAQRQRLLFEEFRLVQTMVEFEHHVLQGKPKRPKVIAREEGGTMTYYTV